MRDQSDSSISLNSFTYLENLLVALLYRYKVVFTMDKLGEEIVAGAFLGLGIMSVKTQQLEVVSAVLKGDVRICCVTNRVRKKCLLPMLATPV